MVFADLCTARPFIVADYSTALLGLPYPGAPCLDAIRACLCLNGLGIRPGTPVG